MNPKSDDIGKNIEQIFERKRIATIALCRFYAGLSQQKFRERQVSNAFWNNQTGTAYAMVFSGTYENGSMVGFFLAHAVIYGVYLELANDRKNEALLPIVMELYPAFQKDLQKIWK